MFTISSLAAANPPGRGAGTKGVIIGEGEEVRRANTTADKGMRQIG